MVLNITYGLIDVWATIWTPNILSFLNFYFFFCDNFSISANILWTFLLHAHRYIVNWSCNSLNFRAIIIHDYASAICFDDKRLFIWFIMTARDFVTCRLQRHRWTENVVVDN